ncbi:MAG: phage tail tape measure protein, partial [Thermoleophilia bacterium]|nr:phage tail tape measure protein [Thermoleophilia bacterium]
MTVGEVVAKLRLDIGEFRSGLGRANALLEKNREVALRASAMLSGIGAAAAAGLGLATREAAEFEAEMRNVNSILKLSEDGFQALSRSVLGLAGKTGKAPQDLARGLYDIASSGFDGAEGLQILEASAIAATAGITDTATAVKAGTAVLNAYGMKASEIGHVQDVLFKTVERGVITYEQLALNLGDVVSMAAQAKIPLEEIGAAIAAMTKAGVQPAEAFTSLNQVLLSFIKPTDQAKEAAAGLGIDLSAAALEAKGLSGVMTEVARAVGSGKTELADLAKSGRSDAEFMEALSEETGTASERLAEIFPNVRALRGALVLAAEGGRGFSEEVLAMADATGSAASAFAEQSKSFKVQ